MGDGALVRLIAGLGNPGPRYDRTRHNVGFLVLDELQARLQRGGGDGAWRKKGEALVAEAVCGPGKVLLVKPQSFMNLSGRPVGDLQRFFKCEVQQVVAIHDDVDLPFGQLRVKRGGGDGGHNGISSLTAGMGSAEFLRVRCGVGRPTRAAGSGASAEAAAKAEQDVVDWVLGRFSSQEERELPEFLGRAADAVEALCVEGLAAVQNRFNRRTAEAPNDN